MGTLCHRNFSSKHIYVIEFLKSLAEVVCFFVPFKFFSLKFSCLSKVSNILVNTKKIEGDHEMNFEIKLADFGLCNKNSGIDKPLLYKGIQI